MIFRMITNRANPGDPRDIVSWSTVQEPGSDAAPADGSGSDLAEVFYIDQVNMPVVGKVFMHNYKKFEINTGGNVVQKSATTLTGNVIAPGDIVDDNPTTLKRANTVGSFAIL